MTTREHLEYAHEMGRRTDDLVQTYVQDEWRNFYHSLADIHFEARLAFHHALQAQKCQTCQGRGYACSGECRGDGWIARAE